MIVDLAKDMQKIYPAKIKIDEDRLRLNIGLIIDQGFAYVGPRSVILGIIDKSFYSNDMIAREILWIAEDGQGMRLKRKFEEWAMRFGVSGVYIALNAHSKLKGYEPVETVWSKLI